MKDLLVQCPSVSVKTKNVGSIRDFLSAEFLLDFPMGVRVGVDNLPEGNITIDKKNPIIEYDWLCIYIHISQSTIVYQHSCLQSSMYKVIHLH